MRSLHRALLPLATVAIVACGVAPPDDGDTGHTEERSVGAVNGRWPTPVIPVCWNTAGADSTYVADRKRLVQSTVQQAYGGPGGPGVTFTGWGTCTSGAFDGIVISIMDQNPQSDIGRLKPTNMILNFTMIGVGKTLIRARCTDSQQRIDQCIQMSALHEFGHAVGLIHEEMRTETPNCGVFYSHLFDDLDVNLGQFDPGSMMNHCNPDIGGATPQTWLSPGDIAGIQFLFGRAASNPANAIAVSFASSLLPWYFIRTQTGVARVSAMEGAAQDDAVFYVVPGVNGVANTVSFRSKANPNGYLRAHPFTPLTVDALGVDATMANDSSWTIDTNAFIRPGDSGLKMTLADGRAMRVGAQNQLYATVVSSGDNPAEYSFVPRTPVPERFLRSGRDNPNDETQPYQTGTYLAHADGALVPTLEKLSTATHANGNWELVAGIGNPQDVSLRFTDAVGAQHFIMEQGGTARIVSAAVAASDPLRATFQRKRITKSLDDVGLYQFLEAYDPALALCQKDGVGITMCRTDQGIPQADITFWQSFAFGDVLPGVSGGVDYCAAAETACEKGDQATYKTDVATCTANHGAPPPCDFFAGCAPFHHWCPAFQRNGLCQPGYCLPSFAMCMSGAPCSTPAPAGGAGL